MINHANPYNLIMESIARAEQSPPLRANRCRWAVWARDIALLRMQMDVALRARNVVIRSDRSIHTAEEMPSPEGTPKADRVYRLVPDGALLRWAFSNVNEIARTYAEIFPDVTSRDVEISAPVRVVARLSGSRAVEQQVEDALGANHSPSSTTPVEAMEDALLSMLTNAIARGRLPKVATVLETQMRLQVREGHQFGKSKTTDISDIESPEWIGRQFRDVFAPIGAEAVRVEIHKRGTRFWTLSDELIDKALSASQAKREDLVEDSDPRAFCIACSGCDYESVCEIRPQKLRADARAAAERGRAKPVPS